MFDETPDLLASTSARQGVDQPDAATLAYIRFLVIECQYRDIHLIGSGRYAAIMPLLFTHAIIVGRIGDFAGYSDRWCFQSLEAARSALEAWDGSGEPEGWHRHPRTGRRRTYDEETSLLLGEYVDP